MTTATILAVVLVLAAIVTLLPRPSARRRNMLGYKALCTFTPMSTILLLMTAGIVWLIGSAG